MRFKVIISKQDLKKENFSNAKKSRLKGGNDEDNSVLVSRLIYNMLFKEEQKNEN